MHSYFNKKSFELNLFSFKLSFQCKLHGFMCVGSAFISFSAMKMLIYFHLIITSLSVRITVNILKLFSFQYLG